MMKTGNTLTQKQQWDVQAAREEIDSVTSAMESALNWIDYFRDDNEEIPQDVAEAMCWNAQGDILDRETADSFAEALDEVVDISEGPRGMARVVHRVFSHQRRLGRAM